MNLPMQAEKLLPHRGQMLLIDSVIKVEEESGTALADLSRQTISLDADGNLLAPFYIELVAQAYAAVCGYRLQSLGQPVPKGYLVGVQKFQINPEASVKHDCKELLISVQTVGDFDGFAVVEGKVSCEDKILAEGKIKLFVPQDKTMAELLAQGRPKGNAASWQI